VCIPYKKGEAKRHPGPPWGIIVLYLKFNNNIKFPIILIIPE
jgi:hypothetical protein